MLQLAYLGAIGGDEYLFRLTGVSQTSDDEVLRQNFALTVREGQVLLWIAKGKSNRDIGEILGLSARTVNKHLEQIYVKLGVENRASRRRQGGECVAAGIVTNPNKVLVRAHA